MSGSASVAGGGQGFPRAIAASREREQLLGLLAHLEACLRAADPQASARRRIRIVPEGSVTGTSFVGYGLFDRLCMSTATVELISAGSPSDRAARPVSELGDRARALEIHEPIPQIRLRVGDRGVVDRRGDLLQHEVEQQARLQLADVLVQLLDEVTLDGGDGLLPCIV